MSRRAETPCLGRSATRLPEAHSEGVARETTAKPFGSTKELCRSFGGEKEETRAKSNVVIKNYENMYAGKLTGAAKPRDEHTVTKLPALLLPLRSVSVGLSARLPKPRTRWSDNGRQEEVPRREMLEW